jgi:hypothetical protein
MVDAVAGLEVSMRATNDMRLGVHVFTDATINHSA